MVGSLFPLTDALFNEFFYSWPEEKKPPMDSQYIQEDGKITGLSIQLALAGFSEEDVKVEVDVDRSCIYISGENTKKKDILSKFKCKLNHTFKCSKRLDLADATVSLENGILSVFVPVIPERDNKKLLFGK